MPPPRSRTARRGQVPSNKPTTPLAQRFAQQNAAIGIPDIQEPLIHPIGTSLAQRGKAQVEFHLMPISVNDFSMYSALVKTNVPTFKRVAYSMLSQDKPVFLFGNKNDAPIEQIVSISDERIVTNSSTLAKKNKTSKHSWGSGSWRIGFYTGSDPSVFNLLKQTDIQMTAPKVPKKRTPDMAAFSGKLTLPDTNALPKSLLVERFCTMKCLTSLAIINAHKLQQLQKAVFSVNGPQDERTQNFAEALRIDMGAMKDQITEEVSRERAKVAARVNEIVSEQFADRAALFQRVIELSCQITPTQAGESILQLIFKLDNMHAGAIFKDTILNWNTFPSSISFLRGRYGSGMAPNPAFTTFMNEHTKNQDIRDSLGCTVFLRNFNQPEHLFAEHHTVGNAIPIAMVCATSPGSALHKPEHLKYFHGLCLYCVDGDLLIAMDPVDTTFYKVHNGTTKRSNAIEQITNSEFYFPSTSGDYVKGGFDYRDLYDISVSDHVSFTTVQMLWKYISGEVNYDPADWKTYPSIRDVTTLFRNNFTKRMNLVEEAAKILDSTMMVKGMRATVSGYFRARGLQLQSQARSFFEAAQERDMKSREIKLDNLMQPFATSFNALFMGPPGTGKSFSVKLYSQIVTSLALIAGHPGKASTFVDSDFAVLTKSDVVGSALGETAPMTTAAMAQNQESVVFFDEVYSFLGTNNAGTGPDTYGQEFVDTLTALMTVSPLRQIVICAGYQDQLEDRFLQANPGLPRRFLFQSVLAPTYPSYIVTLAQNVQKARMDLNGQTQLSDKEFADGVSQLWADFNPPFVNAIKDIFLASTSSDLKRAVSNANKAVSKAGETPQFVKRLFSNNRGSIATLTPDLLAISYGTSAEMQRLLDSLVKQANAEFVRRYGSLDADPLQGGDQSEKSAPASLDDQRRAVIDGLAHLVYELSEAPTTTTMRISNPAQGLVDYYARQFK